MTEVKETVFERLGKRVRDAIVELDRKSVV